MLACPSSVVYLIYISLGTLPLQYKQLIFNSHVFSSPVDHFYCNWITKEKYCHISKGRNAMLNLNTWSILCEVINHHLGPVTTFNTFRPRLDGRNFQDGIHKCIFVNENVSIVIKISLKVVTKGPINNIPSLVQIMAWRRSGDTPLSEAMMVS